MENWKNDCLVSILSDLSDLNKNVMVFGYKTTMFTVANYSSLLLIIVCVEILKVLAFDLNLKFEFPFYHQHAFI